MSRDSRLESEESPLPPRRQEDVILSSNNTKKAAKQNNKNLLLNLSSFLVGGEGGEMLRNFHRKAR